MSHNENIYMKNIDIFSLRCLDAAARMGSLTAAARALGVSQPAVTVQIGGIERALGERLLVREARGVRTTPAGDAVLVRARRILDEMRKLEGVLESGPLAGRLRIGSTDVVVLHRLPPILKRFRERHPGVDLELAIEGSASLAGMIRAREIELALVTLPIPDPPGPIRPLCRDRLCFVASPGHDLAHRSRITLRDVAKAPLLAHKTGSVTRALVEGYFTSRGLVPRVSMEVSSPEVLRRMAQSGLGIAVLAEVSVREDCRRGRLQILDVRGWDLFRVSGLLLPPAGPPSRAGREFLSALERGLGAPGEAADRLATA
jgi:molybdate transport repressor ModE-like protein